VKLLTTKSWEKRLVSPIIIFFILVFLNVGVKADTTPPGTVITIEAYVTADNCPTVEKSFSVIVINPALWRDTPVHPTNGFTHLLDGVLVRVILGEFPGPFTIKDGIQTIEGGLFDSQSLMFINGQQTTL